MLPTVAEVNDFLADLKGSGASPPLRSTPELGAIITLGERASRAVGELDQKHLTVGLLGGTGVGKSTLLNAIAGAAISQPGDRRPTTERAVSYRHKEDPAPAWLAADDVAPGTTPHAVDALRGVLLLDLPDLDSFESGHRALVHRAVPHLDLLVVVTTGDKYGDQVLYDEIARLPQAPRNLVFVLNAIDLLTPENRRTVREDFAMKLQRLLPALPGQDPKDARVTAPTIYAISALHAQAAANAGEFTELQAHLERLAGTSERRAVLAANAAAAVQQLAQQWRDYLQPAGVDAGIAALREVAQALPDASVERIHALRTHLEDTLGAPLAERALRASWFPIGPIDFFLRRFRKKRSTTIGQSATAHLAAPFQDDLLDRPLRLARHAAEEALRPLQDRLLVALPEASQRSVANDRVDGWVDRLREQSARWAWRFRQHAIPALALFGTLAWIVAKASQLVNGDVTWTAALWDIGTSVVAAFSPLTLGILALTVVVYYAAIYPYYLYWLDRRIQSRAQQGAKRFVESWRQHYAEVWGQPLGTAIEQLEQWWRQHQKRARPITRALD